MIFALIISAMIFVLIWIVGLAFMKLLGIADRERDIELAYVFSMGLVGFTSLLFLLCIFHGYRPIGVLIGSLLLFATSVFYLRNDFRNIVKGSFKKLTPNSLFVSIILFNLTAPGFFLALLPPYYKDTLIYHLYIPKLMIPKGAFVTVEGLSNSNFPLAMELIYGIGLMVDRPEVCRIVHYGFFWLLIFTTYKLGNRFFKWGGLVAALVTALTPSMQIVASWGYIDIALAFITLTAVAAICDEELNNKKNGLVFIGLVIGFSLWMKYLSLYFAGYSMILLYIATYKNSPNQGKAFYKVGLTGLVAGLYALPWYGKNIIETGNPVYPYFTNIFGGKHQWNEFFDKAYFHLLSDYGYGQGILKFLLAPYYMVRYGKFENLDGPYLGYDGVIGWVYLPLFALLVLGLFKMKKHVVFVKVFSIAILFGFVLWLTNSQQTRFLLPTIALVPLLAMAAISNLAAKVNYRSGILSFITVLSLLGAMPIAAYVSDINPWDYISGKESRHQFLMRIDPLHPIYTYINRNLPDDSKLFLILVGNKRFYLEPEAYSDSIFEFFTIQKVIQEKGNAHGVAAWLKEKGFTHILFDDYYILKPLTKEELDILSEFFAVHTRLVKKDKTFALIEIL